MKQPICVEIGERQFEIPRWTLVVAVIAVLGAGAVAAVQIASSNLEDYSDEQQHEADLRDYEAAVTGTDALRAGCVRSNILRQAAWNNAMIDADSRRAAAVELGAAGDHLLELAALNQADADALVEAASDFPAGPGSPQVECEDAYPSPEVPEGAEPIAQEPLRDIAIAPYKPDSE